MYKAWAEHACRVYSILSIFSLKLCLVLSAKRAVASWETRSDEAIDYIGPPDVFTLICAYTCYKYTESHVTQIQISFVVKEGCSDGQHSSF